MNRENPEEGHDDLERAFDVAAETEKLLAADSGFEPVPDDLPDEVVTPEDDRLERCRATLAQLRDELNTAGGIIDLYFSEYGPPPTKD